MAVLNALANAYDPRLTGHLPNAPQQPGAAATMQAPQVDRSMTRSMAQQPAPQAAPAPQRNMLLEGIGAAINGFQRGFDPQGWQAGQDRQKADQQEKQKQTLALMQQQRQLPAEQRATWWQQNAPIISQIVGQDVSKIPLDPSKFSDQALDGQIAALSAQMGQGPAVPEPMTAYQAAQVKLEQDKANQPDKPIIASPGQRGFQDTNGDGILDEIFSVPEDPRNPNSPGGRVQSQFIDDGGMLNLVMGDGTIRKTGMKARDSLMNVDVGGVPTIGSRYSGGFTPLTTPEAVGGNKSTIDSITAMGKAASDARVQLPAAAMQLSNVIGVAEQLRNHDGFKGLYGGPVEAGAGAMGARFGADAEAQALVDQLGGEAFLQAVGALRGTGPISEREGLAAQQAQSRLKNYNQSDEAAQRALDDFIERAGNVYLLTMLKSRVPFSNEQLQALTPRQRQLVAEWARVEGAQ